MGDFKVRPSVNGVNVALSSEIPSANYRTKIALSGDYSNSTTGLTDVTGLALAVTSGVTYNFEYFLILTSDAAACGAKYTITGPTMTFYASIVQHYAGFGTLSSGGVGTIGGNLLSVSNIASPTVVTRLWGTAKPSASGTLQLQLACNASSHTLTAKTGSTLEYW